MAKRELEQVQRESNPRTWTERQNSTRLKAPKMTVMGPVPSRVELSPLAGKALLLEGDDSTKAAKVTVSARATLPTTCRRSARYEKIYTYIHIHIYFYICIYGCGSKNRNSKMGCPGK